MFSACRVVLAVGILIALGIFTKMTMLHAYGEVVLTFPHIVLGKGGIGRDVSGFIVGGICIILALNHATLQIKELGGLKNAIEVMMDLESFLDASKSKLLFETLVSTLAVLLWAFILHFYTAQRKSHEKVLQRQKKHETDFIRGKCLQFRQRFN
ncbi:MFS transporter, putative [Babesia ovis]|uniref:MFS transporter, putative n=1 Tax=Babesia ovis TaxID=5869 RepID=A0A9W5TD25_BABOV|nr:MFS transporter, putative [Babesia ovis]